MRFLYCLVLVLLALKVTGQTGEPLERRVSLRLADSISLEKALYRLAEEEKVTLSFSNALLPEKNVRGHWRSVTLRDLLHEWLAGSPMGFRLIGGSVVLYPKPVQQEVTLSGYVADKQTGERLIAANIYDLESQRGAQTNEYGFFSLTLPSGEARLQVSYIGYEPAYRKMKLQQDRRLEFRLEHTLTLDEVLVVGKPQLDTTRQKGPAREMAGLTGRNLTPALGGAADIIRSTHLIPGVQTGADGIGGFSVRGGNVGHNLVMIDGVPVYNYLHAAGLLSVVNTDAVKSARLYKGGFPARYGGRLSSVLDIRTKEGNQRELHGRAQISPVAGQFSVEGPIREDRSAFFVSGRWSLLDLFLEPVTRNYKSRQGETGATNFSFYDLNAKFNYTLSPSDRLYLSYYQGRDDFSNFGGTVNRLSVEEPSGKASLFDYRQQYREDYSWGNRIAALRWNHIVSSKLFANLSLTYSQPDVDVGYENRDSLMRVDPPQLLGRSLERSQYRSGIEEYGAKLDFEWLPNPRHHLRYGLHFSHRQFSPGVLRFDETTRELTLEGRLVNREIQAKEAALYLEDEWNPGDQFSLNAGLRAAGFRVDGRTYTSFEPRLSGHWAFSRRGQLGFSFSRMAQFSHLLSGSSLGLPTDMWAPSTGQLEPQRAWQTTLGVGWQLAPGWQFDLDGFYKKMNHLLAYSEGAYFIDNWEDNVTMGQGESYGAELGLYKKIGRLTGGMAYTLSWTNRQFEKINLGRPFPFKYDRRHNFNLTTHYQFNNRWRLKASWLLNSGLAFSLPLRKYQFQFPGLSSPTTTTALAFGSKNQYRLPYYHRLDVEVQADFSGKWLDHTFSAGVYNLYNRKNPVYYDLRTQLLNRNNELRERKKFVQVWLIPVFPYLNYSIRF